MKQYGERELLAHKALMKASERIGHNNYNKGLELHVKSGKSPKTYRYSPTDEHQQIIKASSDVLCGKISINDAMALLFEYDIFKQIWG